MAYVAMYQKFKLIRERNQLELQLHGMTTKLERMGKNISNKEKYYTSLFEKLNQQATNFKNQAKLGIQNMFGLGQGSVNPMNYSGTNGFVLQKMYQYLSSGQIPKYKDGQPVEGEYWEPTSDPNSILGLYQQYGINIPQAVDSAGKGITEKITVGDKEKEVPVYLGDLSYEEKQYYDMVYNKAQYDYNQAQMMMNQTSLNYDTNVSIWLEAQEAQLEAEKDSVLGALQYEQIMMQIDKDYIEMRLQEIEQLEKSYDEKLKKDIERGIPKFGLG